MSSNTTSSNILKFERMSQKSFVSPVGRAKKNKYSSPLDSTVAETPSPGSTDLLSPDGRIPKVLPKNESPTKPFDEVSPDGNSKVQRDFDYIWNNANDKKDDAYNQKRGKHRSANVSGKKSTYHARYLNEIMNGESPPAIISGSTKVQGRIKAPVPFMSTGTPTSKSPSSTPSLSEEIALAQKLGMAETLASVPESAQRALVMQSANPPSVVDVRQFVATPSSVVSKLTYHATDRKPILSPGEDSNFKKYDASFQKPEKKLHFDKIDQMLAREISDAAEDAKLEIDLFKSKATQEQKAPNSEDDESVVPFDCVPETLSSTNKSSSQIQDLEAGKNMTNKKDEKVSIRKILRKVNSSIAGITMKKECRSSSDLNPNKVKEATNSLYDSSIQPNEANSSVAKSKRDTEDHDLFAPITFDTDDKSFNSSDLSHPTIQNRNPLEGVKEDSSGEEERKFDAKTIIYIIILVVLMIIGIIAVLIATGTISFWSRKKTNVGQINILDENDDTFDIFTSTSTSEATLTPTEIVQQSNVFEGSEAAACKNAVPLTEMDQAYYGSNWKAFWDASIDTCGDQMSTGYAVWYSFTTNSSKLVEASTCNNADFDTQITVMSGSCDKTTCVSFNDQACGDQSLVTWYAEANTTYYIMVHGYREATGTFGLTLSEISQNDQCARAERLEDGSVLAGTTAGATSLTKPPTCGDVDLTGDGVWYEVDGISGFYRAELLRGYTDFSGQVAVYRSMDRENLGCDALICEKGSYSGSAIWLADSTYKYYVYVSDKNGIAGDFDLYLGRNKDSSCTFATRIDSNSVGFLASTKASNPQNVESCGYTGHHTAPGLWFSVIGTGEVLEASTCGSILDLDTQISVFGNTCDDLQCIGGTGEDYPCGDNGSISWQTEKDAIYSIYVSGRSSRVGDFILTINEVPEQDGFSCDGSLPLEIGSSTFLFNTTVAPSESVDLCTGTSAVRGVWHQFVGTGMTMKISVCNAETDFDARISVFTGSCNGLSCVAYTQSKCGENDEVLITTHVGVTYYLYVHGSDSVSIGKYLLTIEEGVINDSCDMASSMVLLGSPQYFGSTLSAQNSTAPACNGTSKSESPALWYSFVGTGEDISLSTCSVETDFNTDVRVFSGSCSEFVCLSDVSTTACEDRAMLSFQTTLDEIYYVRIGGTNAGIAGNFLLEVNPRSRFFGP